MNSRIDQITKGLISLAIMLMFAVAFVAGQARANLPPGESVIDDRAQEYKLSILLDAQSVLIDTLRALPIDVDFRIDGLSLRNDHPDAAGSEASPVQ